jgi:hypothetical protein
MLSHAEEQVARYYDEQIYEAEVTRLARDFPVEMRITKRCLAKWMRAGMKVAEVGVGGGEYSEWLVQHGCRVHLIDVSRRLLDTAAVKAAGGHHPPLSLGIRYPDQLQVAADDSFTGSQAHGTGCTEHDTELVPARRFSAGAAWVARRHR